MYVVDVALPSRIGRYEIAGRLARGGMAEVLLGRLQGPHGFDRPVVIKRILPHLLKQPGIVDMFLAEARTIANIRHPNLIQVHELASDGGELFMVMEYLEGESVAGLCRRLAVRGDHLDFALAAHIVAEACAGLHAAHEAVGADRVPLEIVHRDVSPQNLFVSYSGAVHVIDFGIARTATGARHTDQGAVRGKVEYLAPEQLKTSMVLDRRVDVFALGIVLFELASGRRLFNRKSAAESMTAILRDATPSLLSLHPHAPTELDAICLRALAKEREERYQSANEMRRALIAFARRSAGDDDLDERLARAMKQLFADRASEKAAMLERARTSHSVSLTLPAAEADETVELPSAVDVDVTHTAMALAPTVPSEITATATAAAAISDEPQTRRASASSNPSFNMREAMPIAPTLASAKDGDVLSAAAAVVAKKDAPARVTPLVWAAMILLVAAVPLAIWVARPAEIPATSFVHAETPPVAPATASVASVASIASPPSPPHVEDAAVATSVVTSGSASASKPALRANTTRTARPPPSIW